MHEALFSGTQFLIVNTGTFHFFLFIYTLSMIMRVSMSLELRVVTPDISCTKLRPVDGPKYSKETCGKMAPPYDFILHVTPYSLKFGAIT